MSEKRYNISITEIVCILTIITTVLTQVPTISSLFRPVMYVMWILALGIGLINNSGRIPSNTFLLMFGLTIVLLMLEYLLLMGTHKDSFIIKVVPLPLMCYLVGILYTKLIHEKAISNCLKAFFAISFIMFSYIFVEYIGSFSTWLNANYYVYEQKNSAAQIIGCVIIMSAFLLKTNSKWLSIGKTIALGFLFLIIIAMQCRTALIALIFTAAVYYFTILRGRKRVAVTILFVIALIIVINSDNLSQFVIKSFVFNERQTRNLDYFTSGRLTHFKNAWELFKEHPLFGTGHHRVDNLYLTILSDVGLFGFVPIIFLWLSRIARNISAFRKEKTPFTSCVLCLTVFYLFESFAEAYPPFGPGVCAFMFWVVCAFVDTKSYYSKKTSLVEELAF